MLVAFQTIFYDCQGHFFVCILDEPKIYVFFFPCKLPDSYVVVVVSVWR